MQLMTGSFAPQVERTQLKTGSWKSETGFFLCSNRLRLWESCFAKPARPPQKKTVGAETGPFLGHGNETHPCDFRSNPLSPERAEEHVTDTMR